MSQHNLKDLLATPDEQRDEVWEDRFFQAFSSANVVLERDEALPGPDGWPYLLVKTTDDATEPVQRIFEWISTRGVGLVVNAHNEYPDYVFTYGMIWSFRETGWFFQRFDGPEESLVTFEEGQKVLTGPPTEEYWPTYARSVVREFLQQQSVLAPKVLVISRDGDEYDLAFSLESLGNPPEHEHEGILEALSWFMPPHYSLMLISEEGLPGFDLL